MVAIPDRSPHPRFTNPEEYFVWEERQEVRHEYIDGEVYAMSGGTINHSLIAPNFGSFVSIGLHSCYPAATISSAVKFNSMS
jgi:Uma2 family endonuclease